jgi:hypothetical protein
MKGTKLGAIIIFALMFFSGMMIALPTLMAGTIPTEHPPGTLKAGDMITGGGNINGATDAGDIYIWNDGANIYVEFVLEDGWFLCGTHVEVAQTTNGIPQANGNPIPGQFTYKHTFEYATHYIEVIPLDDLNGEIVVAAHAEVCPEVAGSPSSIVLPATVTVTVPSAFTEPRISTFPGTIISGGSILDGSYDAWCANLGPGQPAFNVPFQATVYSSYAGGIPYAVIEKPQNLDALNWLCNNKDQFQTWDICPDTTTVPVTWWDMQMAIWFLIDDDLTYDPANCALHQEWNNKAGHVGYDIAQEAIANGEGFIPGAGEKMVVILAPNIAGPNNQPLLICVDIPSTYGECGTAWGSDTSFTQMEGHNERYGNQFIGKNWATYLLYEIDD